MYKLIIVMLLTVSMLQAQVIRNWKGGYITDGICAQRANFGNRFVSNSDSEIKKKIAALGFSRVVSPYIGDIQPDGYINKLKGSANRTGYKSFKNNVSGGTMHKRYLKSGQLQDIHINQYLKTLYRRMGLQGTHRSAYSSPVVKGIKDHVYTGWCFSLPKKRDVEDYVSLLSMGRSGEFAAAFCAGSSIVEPEVRAYFPTSKSAKECLGIRSLNDGQTCQSFQTEMKANNAQYIPYSDRESFYYELGKDIGKIDLMDAQKKGSELIEVFGTASRTGSSANNRTLASSRSQAIIDIINDKNSCLRKAINISINERLKYAKKDLENYMKSTRFKEANAAVNCPITTLKSDFDKIKDKANKYISGTTTIANELKGDPLAYRHQSCLANRMLDDYSAIVQAPTNKTNIDPVNDVDENGIAYESLEGDIKGLSCGGDPASAVKWSNEESELKGQRESCLKINIALLGTSEYVRKLEANLFTANKFNGSGIIAKSPSQTKDYINNEIGTRKCSGLNYNSCADLNSDIKFFIEYNKYVEGKDYDKSVLNYSTSPFLKPLIDENLIAEAQKKGAVEIKSYGDLNEFRNTDISKTYTKALGSFRSLYKRIRSISKGFSQSEKTQFDEAITNNPVFYSSLVNFYNCKRKYSPSEDAENYKRTCLKVVKDFNSANLSGKSIGDTILTVSGDDISGTYKKLFNGGSGMIISAIYEPFQSVSIIAKERKALFNPGFVEAFGVNGASVKTFNDDTSFEIELDKALAAQLPANCERKSE